MSMGKPYSYLRKLLLEKGIDQEYLAEKLNRSTTYISARMTGKRPWGQDDQYKILNMLNLPDNQLHIVFPRDGKNKNNNDINMNSSATNEILIALGEALIAVGKGQIKSS